MNGPEGVGTKLLISKTPVVKIPIKVPLVGRKEDVVKIPITKLPVVFHGVSSKIPVTKIPVVKQELEAPIKETPVTPEVPEAVRPPTPEIPSELRREDIELEKEIYYTAMVLQKVYSVPYPITKEDILIDALGGRRNSIKLGKYGMISVDEVVKELLSTSKVFENIWNIGESLNAPSWVIRVLKAMYGADFPISEGAKLDSIMGFIDIDRVPISKLLKSVNFPIENISELIIQLSKARRKLV